MEALLTHCAALDVHKATVQVCRLTPDADGTTVIQERKVGTFTASARVIKLACVASDLMGVSGRAMLAALIQGQSDPQVNVPDRYLPQVSCLLL